MKTLALVTGGAGFIGSHIVDRLLADGYRVRVLDNFSTGKRENLPESGDLEVVTGDVGSYDDVRKAMKDVELVFHEAAIASVPKTIQDPIGSQQNKLPGHAERPRGRPSAGHEARGVRLLSSRLRRSPGIAQARGHATQTAVTVRR